MAFDLEAVTLAMKFLWCLLWPGYLNYSLHLVCPLPMRWVCAGMFLCPYDLWPWRCRLDFELLSLVVYMVFEIYPPNSVCMLPMMERCALTCFWEPMTLDLCVVTLILKFFWQSIAVTVSKPGMHIVTGEYVCTGIFVKHCFIWSWTHDLDPPSNSCDTLAQGIWS